MIAPARRPAAEISIEVMTYDVDFAAIVHNMVYIRWLEDLRTRILNDTLSITEMLDAGISPILTKTTIEYLRPVRLGDVVCGRMWVTELGRTRWTVRSQISVDDVVATDATQEGYFANLATLRPIRIPPALRTAWEAARDS